MRNLTENEVSKNVNFGKRLMGNYGLLTLFLDQLSDPNPMVFCELKSRAHSVSHSTNSRGETTQSSDYIQTNYISMIGQS